MNTFIHLRFTFVTYSLQFCTRFLFGCALQWSHPRRNDFRFSKSTITGGLEQQWGVGRNSKINNREGKNIRYSRAHVSNSGLWAKYGPKFNHNLPARSYQICIRAGPRSIISFYFKFKFYCVCNIDILLLQILCLSDIKVCFHMKRLNTKYQWQLIFQ